MSARSTKRQQELLEFVSAFIREHGYGPSYREIMNGLGYKSVSTVATHIDGLITKGYLLKRDNSARSLEVVHGPGSAPVAAVSGGAGHERWLVDEATRRFDAYEKDPSPALLDELYVLVGTLKVLGLGDAYKSLRSRLLSLAK